MYQEFTGIRSDQLATNLSGKFSMNIYTDGARPYQDCNRFWSDCVVRRAKEAKKPAAKKGQVTYKKITLDQPQFKSKNRTNEYIKIMAAKKRLSSAPRVAIRCVEQCQGNPAHGGGRASSRQPIYNCIKTSKFNNVRKWHLITFKDSFNVLLTFTIRLGLTLRRLQQIQYIKISLVMILGFGDVFVSALGEDEREVLVFFGCGLAVGDQRELAEVVEQCRGEG